MDDLESVSILSHDFSEAYGLWEAMKDLDCFTEGQKAEAKADAERKLSFLKDFFEIK